MNHLTVEDLNPDGHLSAAIVATFTFAVSHLHTSPIQNGCLIKVLQWDRYTEEELYDNFILACFHNPSGFRASTASRSAKDAIVNATFAAHSAACAVNSTTPSRELAHTASRSAEAASLEVSKARLGCVSQLEFIHDTLKALLPLILNYKINNSKRPFESPDEILDMLGDRDKQQFLFNLDLLA